MLKRVAALAVRRKGALVAASRALSSGGFSIPGTPRSLDDVANIEMLQAEEPLRVGAIWEAFHLEQPAMAGTALEPAEFSKVAERGAESPMFVFPVRREGGHFMLLSQYSTAHNMFVMTFLKDYQDNPSMAQPWASVHLFDDLVSTKGVGLMRVEVVPERLSDAEAEHLMLLVRRFYGTTHYDKAWTFNHFEKRFDLDGYLASCP